MAFLNPFHFIPVNEGAIEKRPWAEVEKPVLDRQEKHRHLTHDRYIANTKSGTLLCRLTIQSPTVVGAHRTVATDHSPSVVTPFLIPNGGKLEPAIPETTLRGCISSIFEAWSGSALRVLADSHLSMRSGHKDALSATGVIVGKEGQRRLLPLTWPVATNGRYPDEATLESSPNPMTHKIYLYEVGEDPWNTRSFGPMNNSLHFIRLGCEFHSRPPESEPADVKTKTINDDRLLLGRKLSVDSKSLLFASEWNQLPEDERVKYHPGLLRNFGPVLKRRLSRLVKYPWFLPIHAKYCDLGQASIDWSKIPESSTLEAESACRVFESIAKKQNELDNQFPFRLNSSSRSPQGAESYLLRQGDIVCFRRSTTDPSMVESLAISSKWRSEAGTVHEWFASINPDLVPMNPGRSELTLAEQVFGFVESASSTSSQESDRSGKLNRPARSLASRVRFSIARLASTVNCFQAERTLQILSSPKPPSPPLYFRNGNGDTAVTKDELARQVAAMKRRQAKVSPQGRKYYLVHANISGTDKLGETLKPGELCKQKSRVKPLKPGTEFSFEVRFDNLTDSELGILLLSLEPAPGLLHRMGAAKPFGFGQVRIQVLGAKLVDRKRRYDDDPIAPRESDTYVRLASESDMGSCWLFKNPRSSAAKQNLAFAQHLLNADSSAIDLLQLKTTQIELLKRARPNVVAVIQAMGSPVDSETHVKYPANKGQDEKELFKWHVENLKQKKPQFLRPLTQGKPKPDPLKEY